MSFIHLHAHSPYSFLDGASTIDRLLDKAQLLDMPALALTDHNRLTGAIRFYEKAKARGVKPIIGAEVDVEDDHHLTLLCKDIQGYSSLCRLLTEAHLLNRSYLPQATRETLRRFRDGLIALSGCHQGDTPQLVARGEYEEAVRAACFYRDVYGEDFFIELINHPSRKSLNDSCRLAQFAQQQRIQVVATNNVHYAEMSDYAIKELLNAIDHNIAVSQLGSPRTMEQYLKSYAEDLKSLLEDSDFTESKAFLRSFIKKIVIDGEKATIYYYYKLPVPPDGKRQESLEVLPIVTPGGDRGNRTPNLCIANAVLSQLSYIPTPQ
jgi:error-prone DNA polymerase